MNVLYVNTHDTGRYIEPYGHPVMTPNLVELAKKGTLFRQAYCVGPSCSPSRAGLLTGMYAHSCNMLGLAHLGFGLNDYSKHICRYLEGFGYETVLCGTQHVAAEDHMIGYKKIITCTGSSTKMLSKAEQDIENAHRVADYLINSKDERFFLSFGIFNPHRDFTDIDERVNPNYTMPPHTCYDTEENRSDMAAFISSAMVADKCVGIVMDALVKSGKDTNTIVIFTTDHGIAFPKMKCTLYDDGIGVSLIMKYPDNPKEGRVIDSLVSQIDIFPTICDLIGIDKPQWLQGQSMISLFNGDSDSIRDAIFSEINFHVAYEPMRCIRTERYKLIKFFDIHNKHVACNIDDSLSKDFLIGKGYLKERRQHEMLFDLHLDPVERVNLIYDNSYSDVYRELSEMLGNWMEGTDDPILKGKIEAPQGAIVRSCECINSKSETLSS